MNTHCRNMLYWDLFLNGGKPLSRAFQWWSLPSGGWFFPMLLYRPVDCRSGWWTSRLSAFQIRPAVYRSQSGAHMVKCVWTGTRTRTQTEPVMTASLEVQRSFVFFFFTTFIRMRQVTDMCTVTHKHTTYMRTHTSKSSALCFRLTLAS